MQEELNDTQIDNDLLKPDERLLSVAALNPFLGNLSSPRGAMLSSHLSQALTLNNGDERIIQTGLEKQLGDNTFSVKLENDSRIIDVIKMYGGLEADSVYETTKLIIIFEDLKTNMIDYLEVPRYFSLHQYFGFSYVWNDEALRSLTRDKVMPAGTIFANSPSVGENNSYKFGLNANVLLATIPEVAEDGMVITESFAERLGYCTFEKRSIEFGSDSFPLNIYGDENNYKPFPDIGEKIGEDSVFMVLRKYDNELAPALNSIYDVREFNSVFDEAIYVKPGVVEDIKIYATNKFRKNTYNGTSDTTVKYVDGMKKFHGDIIKTWESLETEHYRTYRNNNMHASEKLNKLLMDSYAIINPDNKKIRYTYKNEEMDIFRIEVVIKKTIKSASIGNKITNLHGGKGVVVKKIIKDEDAPYDANGNRIDVIADPNSIPGRMNISVVYEQYFNAASRKVKAMVIDALLNIDNAPDVSEIVDILTPEQVSELFKIPLGLTQIIGNEQYDSYNGLLTSNNVYNMQIILKEIVEKEMFIYYTVKNKKTSYDIVEELKNSIYAPELKPVMFNKDGVFVPSKNNLLVAPLYMIMLFKTGDEFLSVSSAKTNHYGFPISVSKANKTRLPWRSSPVKVVSETENRLFTAYGTRAGMAELKDRANSPTTHSLVYENILKANEPTNVDALVNRKKDPYGTDVAIQLVTNIMNCAGIDLEYQKERRRK